jgi:hypothetical protein
MWFMYHVTPVSISVGSLDSCILYMNCNFDYSTLNTHVNRLLSSVEKPHYVFATLAVDSAPVLRRDP